MRGKEAVEEVLVEEARLKGGLSEVKGKGMKKSMFSDKVLARLLRVSVNRNSISIVSNLLASTLRFRLLLLYSLGNCRRSIDNRLGRSLLASSLGLRDNRNNNRGVHGGHFNNSTWLVIRYFIILPRKVNQFF
jgi:hypothetical protein